MTRRDSLRVADVKDRPAILEPQNRRNIGPLLRAAGITNFPEELDDNRYWTSRWVYSDGSTTVACLWWDQMRQHEDGEISTTIRLRYAEDFPPRSDTAPEKALELLNALKRAKESEAPVRVLVCLAKDEDDESQGRKAKARNQDPVSWWVTDLDWDSGLVTLKRGGAVSRGSWSAAKPSPREPLSREEQLLADLAEIDADPSLTDTERQAFRYARIGQGKFRADLMERWGGRCAVTGCAIPEALRASHIVPWRDASPKERLDPNNGLLLSAGVDALFDRFLITFGPNGALMEGPDVSEEELRKILPARRRIDGLNPDEIQFLKIHRSYFDSRKRR